MAYYDVLKTAWNNLTQPPPGVTGAALTGLTTDQKLTAVMLWRVVGPAMQMVVPTYMIYNLIVGTEFSALTAANQQLVRDILGMGIVDGSPGTQVRARIVAIFPNGTTTFANLAALAANYDAPKVSWLTANGYPAVISGQDAVNAGLN